MRISRLLLWGRVVVVVVVRDVVVVGLPRTEPGPSPPRSYTYLVQGVPSMCVCVFVCMCGNFSRIGWRLSSPPVARV